MKALRWTLCAALAFGSALMVGCDKDDKKPDVPTPKAGGDTGPAILDKAKTQAGDAMKGATDAGKTVAGKTADAVKTANDTGVEMMAGPKAEATALIAKLQAAIEANKLDDAKTYLDKLDTLSAKLPSDLQSQITGLRTAFATAKAKAGAALPGGSALPGANK